MKASLTRFLLIGFLAVLAAGCSQGAAANPTEAAARLSDETALYTETPIITGVPTQTHETEIDPALPIPAIPGLPPLIEKAKADLAQRLSVPADQIDVMEAQEVSWPDASLGCPQPGATYDEVQVPGYLILLGSNGGAYEYHANIHNYVFYCENPTPPILETPTNGLP